MKDSVYSSPTVMPEMTWDKRGEASHDELMTPPLIDAHPGVADSDQPDASSKVPLVTSEVAFTALQVRSAARRVRAFMCSL